MNKFILNIIGIMAILIVLPWTLSFFMDWLIAYFIVGICLFLLLWRIRVNYETAARRAKRGKTSI
jgi:hypothetical protein